MLALLVCASLVLSGCSAKKSNDKKDDKTEKNEKTEQNAFEVPEGDKELVAYSEALEAIVSQVEPKADLDNEILGAINGVPLTAAQVKYAASYTAYCEVQEGKSGEELAKIDENTYKEWVATLLLSKYYNIEADDTIKNYVNTSYTSMKEYYDSLEENGYENSFVDQPFTPHFYHYQTLVYQYLYQQIYVKFCEDEAVKNKAVEDALNFYENNDYVRAKHILIQFPEGEGENGELTDAQKAATLEEANAVLAEVNAMTDISEFDALVEKYNDDPGMQSNPGGYYFTKGEMVLPFEESAYSLEIGQTSGLVETDYGYHILLKLPLDDKEVIPDTEKFGEFTTEAFYAMIEEKVAEEYDIVYADNYEERFNQFSDEYKAIMSKTTD